MSLLLSNLEHKMHLKSKKEKNVSKQNCFLLYLLMQNSGNKSPQLSQPCQKEKDAITFFGSHTEMTDILAQLEDALFYPREELSSVSNDLDQMYQASEEPAITKKIKKDEHIIAEAPQIFPVLEQKEEKKEIEIIALSDNSGEQRDDETSQQKLCSDMQLEKQEEIVILQQGDIPNISENALNPSIGCQLISGNNELEGVSNQNEIIHPENGQKMEELGQQINNNQEQKCEKQIENEKQEATSQSDNLNDTQTQLETIKAEENDKQDMLKLFWIDYLYRERQYLEWLREMAIEQEKQEAQLRKAYISLEPADDEQADKWKKIGNKLKPNLAEIPKVKGKRGRKRKVDIQAAQELAKATLEAEQQLAAEQQFVGLSQIENLQDNNQLKEIKPFSDNVEKIPSEMQTQLTSSQVQIADSTNKPSLSMPLPLVGPNVSMHPNNYPNLGDNQLFRIVNFINSDRYGISLEKNQELPQKKKQPSLIEENSPDEEEGFIQIHDPKLEKPAAVAMNVQQSKLSTVEQFAVNQIEINKIRKDLTESAKTAAKKVPQMIIDLESNDSNSPSAVQSQNKKIFTQKKKPIQKNKVHPLYGQSNNLQYSKKINPINELPLPTKANTIKQFETITVDSDEDDLNDPKKVALPDKNTSTQIPQTKNTIIPSSGNAAQSQISQERYQQFLARPPYAAGQGMSSPPRPSHEDFYKNSSSIIQTGGNNQSQMLPPAYPNEHFRQYHSQQSGFGQQQSAPSAPFLIPSSASRQSDQNYFAMMNSMNPQNQDLLSHMDKQAGFHYPNISPFNNGFSNSLQHPMPFNYHQLQNDPQLQHFQQYPVLYQPQQQQFMQTFKQFQPSTSFSLHDAKQLADGQLRRS